MKAAAEAERRRRASLQERYTSDVERWRSDPTIFAHEVFGIVSWRKQAELLRAIAQHPRVACRAGQRLSKTNSLVLAALWFAACWEASRTIATAPTYRQVDEIFWHELKQLWFRRKHLSGKCNDSPGGGLVLSNGSQVFGFTTAKPEKMSGFAGAKMLYIVDEASGMQRSILEAIDGNRAGGAHIVMTGNPTQVTGPFYDAFHTDADYKRVHISSLESPNVISGKEVIPGLATRAWAEERKREWGENSPMYQARVLGEFPIGSDDNVISLSVTTAAFARYAQLSKEHANDPLELGVDVARFGSDRTVFFPKRGRCLYAPTVKLGQDVVTTARQIFGIGRTERQAGRPAVLAKVDDVGVGGGLVDVLATEPSLVEVVPLNASEAAPSEEFSNLRAQMMFGLAQFLEEGGALPPNVSGLEAELLEARYVFDARGRRKVEPKADIKKRVGRSPDLADGAMLAVFQRRRIVPKIVTGSGSRYAGMGRGYG